MSLILQPGRVVRTQHTNLECHVGELLGSGGQGEVYKAHLGGREVALKWYYPPSATASQKTALEELVKKGAPNSRFLWPIDLAAAADAPDFGYVMPIREARFRSVVDLMKRRIDPSFRALTTAGFELAHSFLQLHSKGLCYRDISFGNLFLDPDTGEILVCDNDNVTVNGDGKPGVLGTPRFMAPEVVRGDALPSTETDLFSLAVLLFYLFHVHHPLEGRREAAIHSFDLPAMTKLYGTDPLFIFHPHDRSNEPLRGYHDNALDYWPIYPQFLRDLFLRSFTDGLRDPANGRVREGEWRSAMVRLRDSIVYCAACGAENFYSPEALREADGGVCWSCSAGIRLPFRMRVGKNVIMLNHDTQIFPHHVDDGRGYDFSAPIASVTRHPTQPDVWGLKNLSGDTWSYQTTADATPGVVPPGRSVTLASGTRINFGRAEGEIR